MCIENTVKEFTIGQNYPNPVHNATTIEFSVPQAGFMSLKVYNVFGGLVRTLAEEILQPGNYVRVWNAAGLPGGNVLLPTRSRRYNRNEEDDSDQINSAMSCIIFGQILMIPDSS